MTDHTQVAPDVRASVPTQPQRGRAPREYVLPKEEFGGVTAVFVIAGRIRLRLTMRLETPRRCFTAILYQVPSSRQKGSTLYLASGSTIDLRRVYVDIDSDAEHGYYSAYMSVEGAIFDLPKTVAPNIQKFVDAVKARYAPGGVA